MYQVTIKGRTLEELKKAVADINDELSSGIVATKKTVNAEIQKDLSEEESESVSFSDMPFC